MRIFNVLCTVFLVVCVAVLMTGSVAGAAEKYEIDLAKLLKLKSTFDDPRPMPDFLKIFLPPAVYKHYTYDIEKMKALQAEVVGFKAPDIVGKIAPEITPGKYTYQDKGNKPGLKALMIPFFYEKLFRPGGPPMGATFSEFELVPTRQYYSCLPWLEATMKNNGKTKVNAQGFWDWKTWEAGLPFPRPSGTDRIKAMQIIYNLEISSSFQGSDGIYNAGEIYGVDTRFRMILKAVSFTKTLRVAGRVTDSPYGWYDKRAKELGEYSLLSAISVEPRDAFGNTVLVISKLATEDANQLFAYAAALRRVRKMTGTDTQDTQTGAYTIMDDMNGFNRKLSPTMFPYEYKILADREYLFPAKVFPGDTTTIARKEMEFRNLKMERRPVYVIELTQKDPTYVYGRTILYVDKETFGFLFSENYDQRGRLWRTAYFIESFHPESAVRTSWAGGNHDVQAQQTSIGMVPVALPINFYTREDFGLQSLQSFAK